VIRPLPRLVAMPREQALSLLASDGVGRLARTGPGVAAVRVLRHLLDDGQVILRIRVPSGGFFGAACGVRVTYQVDRIDMRDHTGWTVIVTGPAGQVTDPSQRARYGLPLRAWPGARNEQFMRIAPADVTGYRLTRDAP
jgi:hypothetical protein